MPNFPHNRAARNVAPHEGRKPQPPREYEESTERYVIHLPFNASTLDDAMTFAAQIAGVMAFAPSVEHTEITISLEDEQNRHYRIICGLRTAAGSRCDRREGHLPPCLPL